MAALYASAQRTFHPSRVLPIEEHRTTKTCHCCGHVLEGVIDMAKNTRKGAPPSALDRGAKHCSRSHCSAFLDRDTNAALNIRKVLIATLRGEERPQHLRRDCGPEGEPASTPYAPPGVMYMKKIGRRKECANNY